MLKSRDVEVKAETVKKEVNAEPVKVEPVKDEAIEVNFEKLTTDELVYDINSFLYKEDKGTKGINSKTEPFILRVIKILKITKHDTEAEKNKFLIQTKMNHCLIVIFFELEKLILSWKVLIINQKVYTCYE